MTVSTDYYQDRSFGALPARRFASAVLAADLVSARPSYIGVLSTRLNKQNSDFATKAYIAL